MQIIMFNKKLRRLPIQHGEVSVMDMVQYDGFKAVYQYKINESKYTYV